MCGFDCIWIDLEHVPNNMKDVEDAVRAAKIYDVDVLTRVSKGCYSDICRPLEGDSTGVMVPHLMSLEEAKQIVYYTKFHPIGRRPLDGGNADGAYCLVDANDYLKQANEERFTVVQSKIPSLWQSWKKLPLCPVLICCSSALPTSLRVLAPPTAQTPALTKPVVWLPRLQESTANLPVP
jgi:4-hydroxy-2-oxoheptanedioate aldolase